MEGSYRDHFGDPVLRALLKANLSLSKDIPVSRLEMRYPKRGKVRQVSASRRSCEYVCKFCKVWGFTASAYLKTLLILLCDTVTIPRYTKLKHSTALLSLSVQTRARRPKKEGTPCSQDLYYNCSHPNPNYLNPTSMQNDSPKPLMISIKSILHTLAVQVFIFDKYLDPWVEPSGSETKSF